MARSPSGNRRTGDQVLIDSNTDDIAGIEARLRTLERWFYWVLGAASGIGFVAGLFAKPIAHMILP
jgi:hypothetical protein